MIVRGIEEHPEWADNFDYFNDYDDTLRHLERLKIGSDPERLKKIAEAKNALQVGFDDWMRRRQERMREQYP